jgi:hypothetical protein
VSHNGHTRRCAKNAAYIPYPRINIIDLDMPDNAVARCLVRAINVTGYNLSKAGIHLTDMERAAQRIAAEFSYRQ